MNIGFKCIWEDKSHFVPALLIFHYLISIASLALIIHTCPVLQIKLLAPESPTVIQQCVTCSKVTKRLRGKASESSRYLSSISTLPSKESNCMFRRSKCDSTLLDKWWDCRWDTEQLFKNLKIHPTSLNPLLLFSSSHYNGLFPFLRETYFLQ